VETRGGAVMCLTISVHGTLRNRRRTGIISRDDDCLIWIMLMPVAGSDPDRHGWAVAIDGRRSARSCFFFRGVVTCFADCDALRQIETTEPTQCRNWGLTVFSASSCV